MTSIETGPTWSEKLNPRNWTLAAKLVLIGLVPALLALTLGVLRVADQAGTAADLGRSSRLLDIRGEVAEAGNALRSERNEATLFAAGNRTGDSGVLEVGFGQGQAEVEEMLAAVRGATELEATTLSALGQAESELSQIDRLRADVVGTAGTTSDQVIGRYTTIIEGIDVLDRSLLRQLRTPGTAGLADALTAITDATEQLARQHTVLSAAIRSGFLQIGDAATINSTDTQLISDYREYQVALTPAQLTLSGNFIDDAANVRRVQLKDAILATPGGRPISLDPAEWDTAYNGSAAAAGRSSELIRQELVAASIAAEEQASNQAGINSVILMLGLLIGITIAVLIARALIRSLRVLRTAALDVAERRLPQAVESMRAGETPDVTVDPVPITSLDEVGQVARAFDAVHGQAVRLAADQAALQSNVSSMFVNLSRRSQALVERQLQLIEQLESNEQDPDQLSNLFQLDHLATRMRRNSENLLVLAGTDLAKRNIAPVPMVDVLRAAVSEVEQYQRIVVQAPPTAMIVGRAASDLVHLLAELLDNATNFSPPDSQVVMSTTRTSDGSIVVEIADRGVGMIDHELSDANQRLGGPSSVDVSASRRMGLFVVGRLGARHGIGVRLASTPADGTGGGLTASVTVPAYLVPSSEPTGSARPIGVPSGAGLPGHGQSAVPPQRAGSNGGPGRSLSALVAGTDGPASPTGPFDGSQDGGQFGGPPVNGTAAGLPSRRPGSSLRPDGPPGPPERPEPTGSGFDRGDHRAAERTEAERAAEQRKARDVAEQARRDQEAADRAARERSNRDAPARGEQGDTGRNRIFRNGTPNAIPLPGIPSVTPPESPNGTGTPTNGDSMFGNGRPAPRPTGQIPSDRAAQGRPGQDEPLADRTRPVGSGNDSPSSAEQPPGVRRPPSDRPNELPRPERPQAPFPGPTGLGSGPLPKRPPSSSMPSPPFAPPAAPTSPAPLVGRGETVVPPRPAPLYPPGHYPAPQQLTPPLSPPPASDDRPQDQLPGPRPHPRRGPQSVPPNQPGPVNQTAPDELFAPSVPVIAGPDTSGRNQPDGDTGSGGLEFGETTPIFEEIASAWFRSNRPVPVTWETDEDGPARPEAASAPAPAGSIRSAPAEPIRANPPPRESPRGRENLPVREQPPLRPRPQEPMPTRTELPVRRTAPAAAPAGPVRKAANAAALASGPGVSGPERDFASVADEGWQAARGIDNDRADELTSAGLPKRRPRARLIPGSAGSAVLAPPVTAGRSAENIRGRLASYQQGVRQGRESRFRSSSSDTGTAPAPAGGHHDEEPS